METSIEPSVIKPINSIYEYENNIKYQKMHFLFNALEEGWNIEKKKDLYIFYKKHENKKEVYLDDYLRSFIEGNINFNKIL